MTAAMLPPTRRFAAVEVGEELPELVIEVTTKLVIAGAMASRDFQDVHHDRDLALERGAPDIFMNILSTNGLVGRYVTDWSGPEAVIRRVAIRLGVPNYPGDVMRVTGRVVGKSAEGHAGLVDIEVRGANSLGDHVTGTVTIALAGKG